MLSLQQEAQSEDESAMLRHCRDVMLTLQRGEAAVCVDQRIKEQLDAFADPDTPVERLAEEVLASTDPSDASELIGEVAAVLQQLADIARQLGDMNDEIAQLPNGKVLAHLCRGSHNVNDDFLCALVAAASIEVLLFRSVKTPPALLREVLELPQLKEMLGSAVVAVMNYLLLPSGINLRNLVWHGFLSPSELAERFPRLLVALLVYLRRKLALHLSSRVSVRADFARAAQFYSADFSAITSELSMHDVRECVLGSAIVLPGREVAVLEAFEDLLENRALSFLCKIACPLEHGLRFLFATSNNSPAHLLAHTRQYYSTLDGFGQRSKHQLLLDPVVSGTGEANRLIDVIGYSTYCCLLDLFMHDSGPGLRSKVAHASIDLDGILDPTDDTDFARLCHVLAVCMLSMCAQLRMNDVFERSGASTTESQSAQNLIPSNERVQRCIQMMETYKPVFHMHTIINRALRKAAHSTAKLDQFLNARATDVTLEESDSGKAQARFIVRIDGSGNCSTQEFSFADRASRFVQTESPPNAINLAGQVIAVCQQYVQVLPPQYTEYELNDDIRVTHSRAPLALFSALLKVLRCLDALNEAAVQTARVQEQLLRDMKARSPDRRQYATHLLAVAPVVVCCAQLSLAMVGSHCRENEEPVPERSVPLPLEKWSKALESFAVSVTGGAQAQDRKGPERALQQLLTALMERPMRRPFQLRGFDELKQTT